MSVWLQTLWPLCPALAQYLLLVRDILRLNLKSVIEVNRVMRCILNYISQMTLC